MTDDPLDAMKARWSYIQGFLFPWMREDNDPITETLGRLVTTLDVIGLEAFVPEPPRGPGRPPQDRRALARAFVAKAVLGVPTTSALIERLDVDKSLRRILGWERRSQVPSEATFSRAFAEFARGALPDKIHAALIERALGGRIIGAIARDATEIEAREKPVQNTANDGKDDPPAPDNPAPPRKRGRPRKGEQRPRPEPTRLKRQVTQNLSQMLADLPTACDVGCKKNSKGYKETWTGYKLHIDVACGQIPVSCVLTSASVHDSQVAIPLMTMTTGVDAFGHGAEIVDQVVEVGPVDELQALDFAAPFGLGLVVGAKVAVDDRSVAQRPALVVDRGGVVGGVHEIVEIGDAGAIRSSVSSTTGPPLPDPASCTSPAQENSPRSGYYARSSYY